MRVIFIADPRKPTARSFDVVCGRVCARAMGLWRGTPTRNILQRGPGPPETIPDPPEYPCSCARCVGVCSGAGTTPPMETNELVC